MIWLSQMEQKNRRRVWYLGSWNQISALWNKGVISNVTGCWHREWDENNFIWLMETYRAVGEFKISIVFGTVHIYVIFIHTYTLILIGIPFQLAIWFLYSSLRQIIIMHKCMRKINLSKAFVHLSKAFVQSIFIKSVNLGIFL